MYYDKVYSSIDESERGYKAMAEQQIEVRELMEQKFREQKKTTTLEDFKLYIEKFFPQDKPWFYKLCTEVVDITKDGKPTGAKGVRNHAQIRKYFYDRYFKDNGERTKRMKALAGWGITEEMLKDVVIDEPTTTEEKQD